MYSQVLPSLTFVQRVSTSEGVGVQWEGFASRCGAVGIFCRMGTRFRATLLTRELFTLPSFKGTEPCRNLGMSCAEHYHRLHNRGTKH